MIDKFAKKNRAALIGLGTIFEEYKKGLENTQLFSLVALMDINPNIKLSGKFTNLPFYSSINELIKNEKLDLLIISTPPESHFSLIKSGLENNLNIIVEKPMVLKEEEIKILYELANTKHLYLNTSYHWQNGEEVAFFNSKYDFSKIQEIEILVNDPYSDNGVSIDESKVHLEGSWIDSGVNALSLVKMWFPFKSYKVCDVDVIFAKNVRQPIFSSAELEIDGIKVKIQVDWRKKENFKRTFLKYDGRKIVMNHTKQQIIDGENVYSFDSMTRLERHYFNYFSKNFNYSSNYDETKKIHSILLQVRDEYEKILH